MLRTCRVRTDVRLWIKLIGCAKPLAQRSHLGLNHYLSSAALMREPSAWERVADTFVDPILVDVSYWKWAERPKMPDGLLEAARADLRIVYGALDKELSHHQFVSGPLSIADIALFPHMSSAKAMEVEFSAQDHPNLGRWFKEMRALPICAADLKRARDYVVSMKDRNIEKRRIFWRGDRIEWMLARGFHAWFFNEIKEDRVAWPGPALPAPMALDV